MTFAVAPRGLTQATAQRILYLHGPAAWTAHRAFAVVFAASIVALWRRADATDRPGHASAEAGVLFPGLAIASESIRGEPTWGTGWTWDARLSITAILFLTYAGSRLLRGMLQDRERGARCAAVLGIAKRTQLLRLEREAAR